MKKMLVKKLTNSNAICVVLSKEMTDELSLI